MSVPFLLELLSLLQNLEQNDSRSTAVNCEQAVEHPADATVVPLAPLADAVQVFPDALAVLAVLQLACAPVLALESPETATAGMIEPLKPASLITFVRASTFVIVGSKMTFAEPSAKEIFGTITTPSAASNLLVKPDSQPPQVMPSTLYEATENVPLANGQFLLAVLQASFESAEAVVADVPLLQE